jgi:hypothetical protein
MRSCRGGDDARERRFPTAWRTPEDDRANAIAGYRLRQQRVGPEKVALTDEVGQRERTHAVRERCAAL